ncbi:MAG: hypothetical protein Q8R13_01070 [bacterium]|nr:hypothetical protein [bacterium]MDZ4296570.1 hypothetical protein [Patescibacteria group bacterium]
MRPLDRIGKILLEAVVTLLIVFVLTEGALRLAPQLIPPLVLLKDFDAELRMPIARRLGLQTRGEVYAIEDGDDVELNVYKPRARVRYFFKDPGIVNAMVMDGTGFCNSGRDTYERDHIATLALGDSLTWCTAVHPEDTWVSQLGTRAGRGVYNLGVPGVGVYQHLRIFQHFGLVKSPEAVILAVYEGNDLRDAVRYLDERRLARSGEARRKREEPPCTLPSLACPVYHWMRDGFIGRYSYAYNLVVAGARRGRNWLALRAAPVEQGNAFTNFRFSVAGLNGERTPFNDDSRDLDEPLYAQRIQDGEVSFAVFDEALETFTELARTARFAPIVLYVPSAHTAYQAHRSFADPRLAALLEEYSARQRQYFRQKSTELDYTFIDPTAYLQNLATCFRSSGNLLYYQSNLHLTAYGHAALAEYLAPSLKQ